MDRVEAAGEMWRLDGSWIEVAVHAAYSFMFSYFLCLYISLSALKFHLDLVT